MPTTPIRSSHDASGARFTDFGGWEMPLQYEGVLREHNAVRNGVGVFDVTHLGRFEVAGPGAVDVVRRLLCNDIGRVAPGRAQYTMALNDQGGIEDDIIVWWLEPELLWVMPNGVNFGEIMARFDDESDAETSVSALRDSTVLLAVQGPDAAPVIAEILGDVPRRFRVFGGEWDGGWFVAAGTGYTGEAGVEICVPAEAGAELWERVLAVGAVPCGLGARDTLRLEMGYPLWGQDLTEETTPLEAGLGWVVDWSHDFVGKPALTDQLDNGITKQLVGFVMENRRPPRPHYEMRAGEARGEVTSGNFSPVLEQGIGMGYMSPPPEPDAQLEIAVRETWTPATIAKPPFVSHD